MEKKIVEMRAVGYTWWEIDQMLFPGQTTKEETYSGKSPSYILAKKLKLPAFSKTVDGIFTPTQVVTKRKIGYATPVSQVAEMFI